MQTAIPSNPMEQMTSRERVTAALNLSRPDRLPRDLWGYGPLGKFRPADLEQVYSRFPVDFARAPSVLGPSSRARGEAGEAGEYTDEWGSVWASLQAGVIGEVRVPPVADWRSLGGYSPPNECLENPAIQAVNRFCQDSSPLYCLGQLGSGPFERLQFLRGTENLFYDLGTGDSRLEDLLSLVHQFNVRHCRLLARTSVDGVSMGDDWGAQVSTLISPATWRRMFRPLYEEYFDILHGAGKQVFFHSDGYIRPIIPDLIDIGVDALNSQLFCMDIEELGRSFAGRLCFWGEIDRQHSLPFGSEQEIRAAVRRVKAALGHPEGGLIAQLSWTIRDPLNNILIAFEEWDKGSLN
jgi:uroporphyrinogen decarboxylase